MGAQQSKQIPKQKTLSSSIDYLAANYNTIWFYFA